MKETHEDRQTVYEIGYLIRGSVAEEKVPAEAEALKKIITDAGSSIIAEEAPHSQPLAYSMRKKTVSGAYEKYDTAYFGWYKFETGSDAIEQIKKSFEAYPSVLRMLLITTVRENTYLGKGAGIIAAALSRKPGEIVIDEKKEAVIAAPVSIEEMDKSIDAMVKEA